jgi:hypothetical protein
MITQSPRNTRFRRLVNLTGQARPARYSTKGFVHVDYYMILLLSRTSWRNPRFANVPAYVQLTEAEAAFRIERLTNSTDLASERRAGFVVHFGVLLGVCFMEKRWD